MSRVAHLIDTTGPGGAETVFLDLVLETSHRGWSSLPVVRGPGWVRDRLVEGGFSPPTLTSHHRFDTAYLRGLRRFVVDQRVDLIHAHLFTTILYSSVVGLTAQVPVIGTFHGASDLGSPGVGTRLRHRIIRRASYRIVFVSASLMNQAVTTRAFRREDGIVIWNGIDTDRFTPGRAHGFRRELGLRDGQILVGAVGNVRPAKGYETLLTAAQRVEAARPGKVRFIVVGDTSHPSFGDLERRLLDAQLGDVLRFAGFREDIPEVLRALDVFVLSSNHEGFSLVTVQALATGLPVVATRCGGPEEILGDSEAGLLVPTENPAALAEALLRLVDDSGMRRTLGDRARRHAGESFSKVSMVDAYERLYEEALGGNVPERMDS